MTTARPFSIVAFLILLSASESRASNTGIAKSVQATPIFVQNWVLQANTSYTIETDSLSTGGDTVMHVQYGSQFIAENDDATTPFGTRRSLVTIAPASTLRSVRVIIHAYSTANSGTATLKVTPAGGLSQTSNITFAGSIMTLSDALATSASITTVEEAGGAHDTVILALSNRPDRAIAFDDDSGLDMMSHIDTSTTCAYPCRLVVGTYNNVTTGTATLVWDDATTSPAGDADGLSDALENVLGLNPSSNDTDADGLPDGAELLGLDAGGDYLKLPMWGADPSYPDIFVEHDWVKCDSLAGEDCGPDQLDDYYQVSGMDAERLASLFGPDVHVHSDIGRMNSNAATRTIWGAWNGATQVAKPPAPPAVDDPCIGRASSRASFFHHGRIRYSSGGQGQMPGACFHSGNMGASLAHELGHNFFLQHGGSSRSGAAQCKPNHFSPMSYAFEYNPSITGFSRNQYAGSTINPTAMTETGGTANTLPWLTSPPYSFTSNNSGSIDWNRDGRYAPAGETVRAAPTMVADPNGCDAGTFRSFQVGAMADPTATWLHGSPARLYVFGNSCDTGVACRTYYRFATVGSLQQCSAANPPVPCATWTPSAGDPPNGILADPPRLAFGSFSDFGVKPTVIPYYRNNVPKLMLINVFGGVMYASILTIDMLGNETWTSPQQISGDKVAGAPAGVYFNGQIQVFALVGQQLRRWTYDAATENWIMLNMPQYWSSGSPVTAVFGISATVGYQAEFSSPQLFAAVPTPSALSSGLGFVKLARYDTSTNWWNEYYHASDSLSEVAAVPSLAYVANDRNKSISTGRLYITLNTGASEESVRLGMTYGNATTAGLPQLKFMPDVLLGNRWTTASGAIAAVYDTSIDDNLRAFLTLGNGQLWFYPVADGIPNMLMSDEDDYVIIKKNLCCSIVSGCPSSCVE